GPAPPGSPSFLTGAPFPSLPPPRLLPSPCGLRFPGLLIAPQPFPQGPWCCPSQVSHSLLPGAPRLPLPGSAGFPGLLTVTSPLCPQVTPRCWRGCTARRRPRSARSCRTGRRWRCCCAPRWGCQACWSAAGSSCCGRRARPWCWGCCTRAPPSPWCCRCSATLALYPSLCGVALGGVWGRGLGAVGSLDAPQLLSCCLNAACMALLDAGLPLAALFCGVTCALQPDGTILLDPTARQEQVSPGGGDSSGCALRALLTPVPAGGPRHPHLRHRQQRQEGADGHHQGQLLGGGGERLPRGGFGVWDSLTGASQDLSFSLLVQMQQCLAAAQRAADTIFQFYRDSVRRRYSKC
uniref:Exosome component 5 n=1 Tax=Ficedula albicollis TaxID=59894 RepID=A0A803VU34_FICAL